MLTTHNFGRISDKIFANESDVHKELISFTTRIWAFINEEGLTLSSSFKELIPVIGNRVCKINDNFYYLTINKEGKLINKKRI